MLLAVTGVRISAMDWPIEVGGVMRAAGTSHWSTAGRDSGNLDVLNLEEACKV